MMVEPELDLAQVSISCWYMIFHQSKSSRLVTQLSIYSNLCLLFSQVWIPLPICFSSIIISLMLLSGYYSQNYASIIYQGLLVSLTVYSMPKDNLHHSGVTIYRHSNESIVHERFRYCSSPELKT